MRKRALLLVSCLFLDACGAEAPKPIVTPTTQASAAPAVVTPITPPHADASLLARSVLFSNPDRAQPQISPDGKQISYLSDVDHVMNVWVGPADKIADAKPITHDTKRGVRQYKWSRDGAHLLYLQDEGGDENWHLHAVSPKTQVDRDLTPIAGVHAQLAKLSYKHAGEVVVGLNDRDKKFHDVWKIDIASGKKTLIQKNEGFSGFELDDDFVVRFAERPNKDGSTEIMTPDNKGGFVSYGQIPMEDVLSTSFEQIDPTGKKVTMLDSRGRNTAALVEIDIASKQSKVVSEDPRADITDVFTDPVDHHVEATRSTFERSQWHVVDPKVQADFDTLKGLTPGDFSIYGKSKDDNRWLVGAVLSDGPMKFYLYDRSKKKADFLFTNQKALEDAKLEPMKSVVFKSRDGLDLVGYLTLPRGGNGKPTPMVLLVHGGPWARDEWGYNRQHQWLASRGYSVLSVNFRGSTGFGKKFISAGDKEWAGKMHDDLSDAVGWAVKNLIADPKKVAIMGGSYGGYSTLVGLTFTPDTFACGVDIVGPANLVTLLNTIPPYWESEVEQFTRRIGDHRTDEGRKFLAARSPLSHADQIKRPLLIGQGKNDPRVKQAESDQIVNAMKAKGIPVTYVLYPDEGHGFVRPENRTSFNAVAETFLAQCLGGPYQPIGDDFKGSSITVPEGAANVFGLDAALKK